LRSCGDDPKQSWSRDPESHLHAAALSDAVLFAPAEDVTLTGLTVAAAHEPPLEDELWSFESVHVMNDSGLCLDVPSGQFSDRLVQLSDCHPGEPQIWSITAAGQIEQQSYCFDLPSGYDADNSRFQVYWCSTPPSSNQQFVFDAGRLQPFDSLKCVAVSGDPTISDAALVTAACDRSQPRPVAQSFYLHGPIQNQGLCLTMSLDSDQVRLAACDGSSGQNWDYYF
jgi:hypothetical protein